MMQTVMPCRQLTEYNRRIRDQHESSDAEWGVREVSVQGPGGSGGWAATDR